MKKYHKLHHHKDSSHKRSLKAKHRHKHKKEQPVSESVLEPIQEVSKEKVKLDKNACGDYAVPEFEDDRKKKSKKRREKEGKTDKAEKLDQEHVNIFAKNYLKKLEKESTNEKLVRHHSLEKSGDSLLNRTKNLFRKEKSFNDAVQKVSVDLEVNNKEHKRNRKRCHKSEKSTKDEIKEKREKRKNPEKSSTKNDEKSTGDQLHNKEKKHKKSAKKRAKSNDQSPIVGKNICSRVQEVIYCQMDQVPYKLKNDKSGAEIKDLYQRIKKEKRRSKEEDSTTKEMSHLHEEAKTEHDLQKYDQSRRSHLANRMVNKEEKKNERSKSRTKRVPDENIQKTEGGPESRSRERGTKDRHHKKYCHHDLEGLVEDPSRKSSGRKRKKGSLSNIDLGPYHKYFAFENNDSVEHCRKKHKKKDEELIRKGVQSLREKRQEENQEEIIYNVEYDHVPCKKHHEKHESRKDAIQESKLKADADKIHQIVEGDLKTYFTKIQHMIDRKLDTLLQINKSRHEKTSNTKLKDRENRKRSKSRTKDKKSETEEQSGSKKEDKSKKVEKNKHDNDAAKEEIIQEVLRRIKKEERSKAKSDKEVATKNESEVVCDKIRKHDSKNSKDFKEISKTCKKCQDKLSDFNQSRSKTQDVGLIQKSSCKRHREDLVHKDLSSSRKSLGRMHEEAKRLQDMDDNKQKGYLQRREERKGSRESRSPDMISSHRHSDKKQCPSNKISLPEDSREYMKNRGSPSPELVVPAADISRVEWEAYLKSKRRYRNLYTGGIPAKEDMSHHSLRKHYTSVSSCRASSEHHLVTEQKSEQVVMHKHDQRHVASDEIHRERRNLDRRRSSSQKRYYRMSNKINSAAQNHISYCGNDRMPLAGHETHKPRERVVASRPEDYIMAPKEHTTPNILPENSHSPDRRRSRRDMLVQYADPNLENIILPPEMFRTPERRSNDPGEPIHYQERVLSPRRHHPKQEFVVQGIEPPILECSRQKSRGQMRARNLECKTVSIVGIPPGVKDIPMVNMTQTSSRSQKSTIPDGNLVEKRKQSKRFKLYYKYSMVNNSKEEKDSGTSEAKSIISDSFRVISEPSDEERATVCYTRDVKITRERQMASELSQVLNIAPKKLNRISTPRDSHLNNIIEEPSNISNSIKNDEYFIPIRGANECYFKAFTSSHSEYCFKINKKPANSNISLLSKDTCDGRYRFYEDGRCRYCKRSKSDVNIISNCHGIQIFRSKSDVFLAGVSGKKVIRSIFLEDSHPYVKSKRVKAISKENYLLQNIFKGKGNNKTLIKDCQTSDVKINYDIIPVDEEGNELVIEDKQRQFKDIYKTIDDLEENIHSSRRTPPITLDVAISSSFMSLDKISDKKPLFKEIYKTIDTLQNKMRDNSNKQLVNTHDVAIGSPINTHRSQKGSRSEPRKNTHEVAVGDSKDQVVAKIRTSGYISENRGKRLKSTGVSPIRVVEELQKSAKSPARKTITPISPNIRPCVTRPFTQKPRNILIREKAVPKIGETKREPISLRPKLFVVKNTKIKSPERAATANENPKNKQVDSPQPIQGIRVLRSEEKSASIKKRENIIQNRSSDKPVENFTNTTEENQLYQRKKSDLSPPQCIIANVPEDAKPIISAPTNNAPVSSKASTRKCAPREKEDVPKKPPSRHSVNSDVYRSCVHHYHPRDLSLQKSSRTTAVIKTPTGTAKTHVTVNTALCKSRPITRKENIPNEGSTSSSLDDSAQNIKRSRSLVEVRTRKKNVTTSKSEIISVDKTLVICKSRDIETNGESVISGNMEKYTNVPRLRCQSSKSAVHSLDQFIGHKFTSRLLLTKDYKGGEISAYQRRKLYDQSIRQKMKRKFRFSKLDVGPQIFEVRFLSMVRPENVQKKEKDARVKHYLDRPLITLSLEKAKTEGSLYQKKTQNSVMVKDEGEVKRENENLDNVDEPVTTNFNFADKVSYHYVVNNELSNKGQSTTDIQKHQDNINHIKDIPIKNINTNVENQSVVELYFQDQKDNQKKLISFCNKLLEVNSSLNFPEEFKGAQCDCSKYSESCQSCKHFVHLMNMLSSSVASYCDSKTKLINFKLEDDFRNLENGDKSEQNNEDNIRVNYYKEELDDLHVQSPNLEMQEAFKNVQEIFSRSGDNSSGESRESTDQSDRIFKNIVDCVSLATTNRTDNGPSLSQPLSCPVLATNTSSFEFLYEETSSSDNQEISRERVFANLTRPFDQTFNFSMSQYNVETPFFRRSSSFSPTGSSESGYASVRSKSCREHSLTNFFKKPDIAALLKPSDLEKRKSEISKSCEQKGPGNFKKSILYEKMAQSCQLYARKVRENSGMMSAEKVDEYQEFSLAFLLGKNSSLVLKSTAISQHSSTHTCVTLDVSSSEDLELDTDELIKLESDRRSNALLDTDDKDDDLYKCFEMDGCKLVLSNECLKTDSITYLGADVFHSEQEIASKVFGESRKYLIEDENKRDNDTTILVAADSSFTLDYSLDSNNPFMPSKDALTQTFFGSLLKVYEKETELCNELFKNDEFLKNVLLPAVNERKNQEKKTIKGRFSRLFKRKLQDNQMPVKKNKCERTSNLQDKALTKLQSLASNAKKCFTMLAEAVKVNENIDDEIKICGLLKLLERIESGDFYMIKNDGDSNIEQDIKSQVKEAFINIYEICEKEAKKAKRTIGDQEVNLIKGFVSKYRIGLLSKTDIVACHIGRGVIQTEAQLKAAVTYLMRSQSNEVNIKEFEEYCNVTNSFEK